MSPRLLGVLTLALLSACEHPATPAQPRTQRAAHAQLSHAAAEDCARCHAEIAAQWRGSLHAQAWTDPLVAREYAADPDPRCVACHAPRTPEGEQPAGRGAHDGVDCISCHAHGEQLIARPELAKVESCAPCHQFHFLALDPDEQGLAYDPSGWLQDTVGEWSRSTAAAQGRGCVDCHMPWIGEGRGRHRSHAFPGVHDPEQLARAVEVQMQARRQGGTIHVLARIEGRELGHAFPTGDLFRSAVLRVWTQERESDGASYRLQRYFAAEPPDQQGHSTLVEALDTRVPPPGAGEPVQTQFRLRSPAARELGWSLELELRPDLEPDLPRIPVLRGSVEITPG